MGCANPNNFNCFSELIFLYSGRWKKKKKKKKKNELRLGAGIILNQELTLSGHWKKYGLRADIDIYISQQSILNQGF